MTRIGVLLAAGLILGGGAVSWKLSGSTRQPAHPGSGVVDSAVPLEEALRHFRSGLAPTDSLQGGVTSLEALVRGFVRALERRDTATLKALELSKREFAYLYYPTNPQALPPYELSPELFWFMLEERSVQGLAHLLAERSGVPLGYVRTRCTGTPSREGANTVYGPCLIERRMGREGVIAERLFGQAIQRGGRWKFVSYANKLD